MTTRRGFLGGLLSALAMPAIVKASNIMAIKNYDLRHRVMLSGFDTLGNAVTEYIDVPETLKDGLDMGFYTSQCEVIRPKFNLVNSITWNQAMPLKRVIERNGWSDAELRAFDETARNCQFIHTGQTSQPLSLHYNVDHIGERWNGSWENLT
jgi:hypothetical protein